MLARKILLAVIRTKVSEQGRRNMSNEYFHNKQLTVAVTGIFVGLGVGAIVGVLVGLNDGGMFTTHSANAQSRYFSQHSK